MGLQIARAAILLISLGLVWSGCLPAQVLARPGWAGSGVAPEPWWRRAVFYRLDPARFQDADGDGKGDLAGVAQRLDYLQSLGVDGLLLDCRPEDSFGTLLDGEALGDLVREASQHRLRVLVSVPPDLYKSPQAEALNAIRGWMGAGVAGVWAPREAGSTPGGVTDYAGFIDALRTLVARFPGERVLMSDPTPLKLSSSVGQEASATPQPEPRSTARRSRRRRGRGATTHAAPRGIDPASFGAAATSNLLTLSTLISTTDSFASLHIPSGSTSGGSAATNSLLAFAQPPATASPNAAAFATVLFGLQGAVILDFGAELGLNLYASGKPSPEGGSMPVMQWTPSNHTQAPSVDASATSPAAPAEPEFGAFHPYRPPPRSLTAPLSAPVRVVADPNTPEALPDPDSLPGFTAGQLEGAPLGGKQLNAITEDRDPHSLLNQYRQLIALHHDAPALRNGSEESLYADGQGAFAWLRRPPAGTHAESVIAAVNLSGSPVLLSLDTAMQKTGLGGGSLRTVLSSGPSVLLGESTARLSLPAHAAFLGTPSRGAGGEVSRRRRRGRR